MKKNNNRCSAATLLVIALAVTGLTGCSSSLPLPSAYVSEIQTESPADEQPVSNYMPEAQTENRADEQPVSHSVAEAQAESPATEQPASNSVSETQITPVSIKTTDANSDVILADAASTKINLNGTSISVNGTGATANGSVLTITKAGTYVISGTLANGQIVVNATNKDKVNLVLNGVNITNLTGAPIYAPQCDKLIVTLADGTANTLTDGGASFKYANITDEEPNAALFSKDDLIINGTGTLTVNAGFNNGIGTKDDLLIASGNLIINAANHGLRGNDSITVSGGNFKITAGNDGMQTNNTEDAAKGFILIEGGKFEIISAHDAIQSDTTLTIANGIFNITAGGGVSKTQLVTSSDTTSDSFKGLKAAGDILITKGTFLIDSYDDCIHANGNINISGGEFTLSTGDDGIHADGDLSIGGGATIINVNTSYEGLEAKTMTIADGIINVAASDDGINISGGSSGNFGRFGADSFISTGDRWLKITGGMVTVIAGRDGIDINGSGEMTGGNVSITAATIGEGNTIDSDGTFLRAGGTLTESGGNNFPMGGGMGGRGGQRK